MNTCLMLRNSWGWGGVGVITFIAHGHVPCTCKHVQCYAAAAFLAGMFTFLAHEHMANATPPIEGIECCQRKAIEPAGQSSQKF